MRFFRLIALLALAAFWLPLQAQVLSDTRWADPSEVDLQIDFPGQGYSASWKLFRCDCGDLMVTSDLNVPGESVQGDLVLVEQKVVLSRGFGQYAEQGAASLDAAALMMQLALRLLQHTAPGGPSQVKEATEVSFAEPVIHLHLDTGAAAGSFLAPWSVKGKIAPAGEDQKRFSLIFKFIGGTPEQPQEGEMKLEGLADFSRIPFPIAAEESLSGWKLDWRDVGVPGAADADTPLPQAATLGELREVLKP